MHVNRADNKHAHTRQHTHTHTHTHTTRQHTKRTHTHNYCHDLGYVYPYSQRCPGGLPHHLLDRHLPYPTTMRQRDHPPGLTCVRVVRDCIFSPLYLHRILGSIWVPRPHRLPVWWRTVHLAATRDHQCLPGVTNEVVTPLYAHLPSVWTVDASENRIFIFSGNERTWYWIFWEKSIHDCQKRNLVRMRHMCRLYALVYLYTCIHAYIQTFVHTYRNKNRRRHRHGHDTHTHTHTHTHTTNT